MPRYAARFRQADVTRVVKAAIAAGLAVDRVEIDADGKITVTTVQPPAAAPVDEFEAWEAKRDARTARGRKLGT
jgi:hypothetical protein